MGEADIAVIGLAVMGQNLMLNMNDHGFTDPAASAVVSVARDCSVGEGLSSLFAAGLIAGDTDVYVDAMCRKVFEELEMSALSIELYRKLMNFLPMRPKERKLLERIPSRRCADHFAERIAFRNIKVIDQLDHGLKGYEKEDQLWRSSLGVAPLHHAAIHGGVFTSENAIAMLRLKRPRRVMLLVKAGEAVDSMIANVLPHLEPGDIVIDGGNSEYTDTNRRHAELAGRGILYVGCGVSGGEEGARYGPSLMPGGNPDAWPHIKHIFQSVAAKTDGEPCCDWVGGAGAGHFVKMVHNGIEYGDMQLISEAYDLLLEGVGLNYDQMADVMEEWNRGELHSFLIEITAAILKFKDEKGEPLLPKIRDCAGQKGTGKWTCFAALENGIPVTLIGEAVFARCLSGLKDERVKASSRLARPHVKHEEIIPDKRDFIKHISKALYASKIVSYAQGFMLMAEASRKFNWKLNFGAIALMWRGGCIIRSRFLGEIKKAFDKQPGLLNLLLDDFFAKAMAEAQNSWRVVVSSAVRLGVPVPAMSSALAFYDGYARKVLPANLIQAQRDYFGAHTYELMDSPGKFFHTNWTGSGGRVTSNAYNA